MYFQKVCNLQKKGSFKFLDKKKIHKHIIGFDFKV
jgi:hypothetical protein